MRERQFGGFFCDEKGGAHAGANGHYRLDLVVKMAPAHRALSGMLRDWSRIAAGKIVTLQQIIDAQPQRKRLVERGRAAG